MKLFVNLISVLAALLLSQQVVAGDDFLIAKLKEIKMSSIEPEVQEKLKMASPEERKGLEADRGTKCKGAGIKCLQVTSIIGLRRWIESMAWEWRQINH